MKQYDISIIIPTYNSEDDLLLCLLSIKNQKYPKNKIEIVICDGGSTDSTLDIARKFNCKIFNNKKRLAEYGVSLGFNKSKGKFITILAADNELLNPDFLAKITLPFKDNNVMLTYPKQVTGKSDTWIASYINTFTDPINHFIYGNAANSRTFKNEYKIKSKNKDYIVYKFFTFDYPMIAFAQGATVRKSFSRKKTSAGDDLMPTVELINSGYDLAYVPQALLAHHTMKSLQEFIRKQRWAIDNYLLRKNYGLSKRETYFSKKRRILQFIWPFYAISIILPLFISIKGYFFSKEKSWIYHCLLTYIVFSLILLEVFRIKILGLEKGISRKK